MWKTEGRRGKADEQAGSRRYFKLPVVLPTKTSHMYGMMGMMNTVTARGEHRPVCS